MFASRRASPLGSSLRMEPEEDPLGLHRLAHHRLEVGPQPLQIDLLAQPPRGGCCSFIGVVAVPLGLEIFRRGEIYAKRHGKLKRSG